MAIRSSQRAILLMVTEEDGDQNYYIATEEHLSWPGGASGSTVGVGYDCGYSTAAQILTDWTPFIGAERAAIVAKAAGIKGEAARQYVETNKYSITITWQESLAQFNSQGLPLLEAEVEKALPNTELLSGDSFGALASLTYNRGASFGLPGSRYSEMRNIKAHMEAKAFDLIPAEFLSMRRLWPPASSDLYKRRTHEALLFRDGLIPPIPTPAAAT